MVPPIALRSALQAAEAEPPTPAATSGRTVRRGGGASPNPAYTQIRSELSKLEMDVAGLKRRLDLRIADIAVLERTASQVPDVEANLSHRESAGKVPMHRAQHG